MNRIISLFLFIFVANCLTAQYNSPIKNKVTLGVQTTADGLIYRGVAATDTLVRKPSIDTMAYMVLDTTTNIMWHYKKATSNAWLRLNLLPSDTASMLTNYLKSSTASTTYTPLTRSISTTAPLQGGGNLSANRTLSIVDASASVSGIVSTGTQTFAGVKTFSEFKVDNPGNTQLTINTNGNLNSVGAYFVLNRKNNTRWAFGLSPYNANNDFEINPKNAFVALTIKDSTGEFIFKTIPTNSGNGTERMRITSTGNVGIGTASPLNVLQIGSTFPITFNANYPQIHFNSYYSAGYKVVTTGYGSHMYLDGATGKLIYETGSSSVSAGSDYNPTTKFVIESNGNVGIGTTNPTSMITIQNTTNRSFDNYSPLSSNGNGANIIWSTNTTGSTKNDVAYLGAVQDGDLQRSGRFYFQVSNNGAPSVVMTINKSGNLGLGAGVVDAVQKLEVVGNGLFTGSVQAGTIFLSNGSGSVISNTKIGDIYTLAANTTGANNIAIGSQALGFGTTGSQNIGVGAVAGRGYTTGSYNTNIGRASMFQNSTGNQNVAIGDDAGGSVTSGDGNTIIGASALDGNSPKNLLTANNVTVIGYNAAASASGPGSSVSNEVTIGNSSTATYRIFGTWSNVSDSRDKTNILPLNYGMNYIEKLKPVSFVWDMRDGGKIGISDIGFIAQDLQKSQIDIGINIPNLITGNDQKLEAAYGVLIPIIVKALQEANDTIKLLELRIINLENN